MDDTRADQPVPAAGSLLTPAVTAGLRTPAEVHRSLAVRTVLRSNASLRRQQQQLRPTSAEVNLQQSFALVAELVDEFVALSVRVISRVEELRVQGALLAEVYGRGDGLGVVEPTKWPPDDLIERALQAVKAEASAGLGGDGDDGDEDDDGGLAKGDGIEAFDLSTEEGRVRAYGPVITLKLRKGKTKVDSGRQSEREVEIGVIRDSL